MNEKKVLAELADYSDEQGDVVVKDITLAVENQLNDDSCRCLTLRFDIGDGSYALHIDREQLDIILNLIK